MMPMPRSTTAGLWRASRGNVFPVLLALLAVQALGICVLASSDSGTGAAGSPRGPGQSDFSIWSVDAKTYNVYFYHIGEGTIWLDDVKLVSVGGKLD